MLKMVPPPALAAKLAEDAVAGEDLLLCTTTDIDTLGQYRQQWLVVTPDHLRVYSDGQAPEKVAEFALGQLNEVRSQSVVGSGLLQVRVNGVFTDALRYSNRLGDRFEKVARKIDRHLHGEPIMVQPEDDVDPRRCPTCSVMLDFPGQACPRCVKRGAVLGRMVKLMVPYGWSTLAIMGLLLVGIALDLVAPQLTRYLVDNVLPGSPEQAQEFQRNETVLGDHLQILFYVVLVLAGVQILRMGVNIFNGRLGNKVGTAITADMRARLVEHMQRLSVSYYDRQQVGSLVGRVAYDTEALHSFVAQLTSGFLFQIIMLVGVGAMMFTLDPWLALYTLIPAPLVVVGSVMFWRYIYPRYYRYWDASSKQAGMLSGMLSGIRVVKAFGQEPREMDRFSRASTGLKQARRNVDGGVVVFNPVMALVFQFGGWIVWFAGGRQVLQGTLTLGELIAFLAYLAMFYGPLTMLTQFTNWLTQFTTQANRIFEILDTPVQITNARDAVKLDEVKGEISFEDVTFGYTRHTPVLKGMDLHIQPGEMIGVVGRSGSGKTTLINMICRFYDVDDGAVKIDGVDVRQIDTQSLRRHIGVVLQEPFLFRGSIWENMTYGLPDATPQQVIAAAKAGNAHDFIMRQPYGYDTWLGERGAGLSGGERQRASIARVLLTNPSILILDEATSAVDAESEAAIQAALAELVKGRTTIAIAHRLSTLREADRIVVMDQGKVAEIGTHEELLGKEGGLYAKLAMIQGQGHEASADTAHVQAQREQEMREGGALRHQPRWLTPDIARIHLGNHDALHVTVLDERIYPGVYALRCLPVRHPYRFLSLRYCDADKREVEIGLIEDLETWPEQAQKLVRDSLNKRYFFQTITGIHGIEAIPGYLEFNVETQAGPMAFTLRVQSDRAQDYGINGKLLLDTDENRYVIPDLGMLPARDRALFQRYIYW